MSARFRALREDPSGGRLPPDVLVSYLQTLREVTASTHEKYAELNRVQLVKSGVGELDERFEAHLTLDPRRRIARAARGVAHVLEARLARPEGGGVRRQGGCYTGPITDSAKY